MANQNFQNDYTEVDSAGDITLNSTECVVSTMQRNAVSYVYRDFGAGYFSDVNHYIHDNFIGCNDTGRGGVWNLVNTPRTQDQQTTDGLGIIIFNYRKSGDHKYALYFRDYSDMDTDTYENLIPFNVYLTINRTGTVGTVYIYSDPARLTLIDTLSIPAIDNTAFRYIMVATSEGDAVATLQATYTLNSLNLNPETIATYGRLRGVAIWG